MTTYVDASVLLGIVLREPQALAGWASIDPVTSELIRVECLRVVDRARLLHRVSEEQGARHRGDLLEALSTFRLVAVSGVILERASDPFPTSLGSLDAIHLATALALREEIPDLELATHDKELAAAARSMGFTVLGA